MWNSERATPSRRGLDRSGLRDRLLWRGLSASLTCVLLVPAANARAQLATVSAVHLVPARARFAELGTRDCTSPAAGALAVLAPGAAHVSANCEAASRSTSARGAHSATATQSGEPVNASALAVIASAIVPGLGQAMLRVERFVPYLAFETYSWSQYAAHVREYRRHRNAYQELSSRVARSAFTIVYPKGEFEFYERMQHYAESGRYEVTAGGMLDPEPDTTTFNGSVWLLARRTFWNDVDTPPDTASRAWKLAADFYQRRAYDQPYRWSWTHASLEYDEYRRLIRRSNDSNRKSLQDLGALIANHMFSAVDAYVTVRLRRRQSSAGVGWEVGGTLPLSTVARILPAR